MTSTPLDHEISVPGLMSLDMFQRLLVYSLYRNLNRICILLLCENSANLNYAELAHSTFQISYFLLTSIQSLSPVRLFVTPWIAALQGSWSITNSWILLKFISIKSVMPFNHLILCHPLLLPPSIFPNIRVFPKESVLCSRWPKYWSSSFSISPSNEYSELISFGID